MSGNGSAADDEATGEEFESERPTTRAEAAAVLRGLADGVDAGVISIGEGEDAIAAAVPAEFDFEVEYEQNDEEVEIEVELEWAPEASEDSSAAVEAAENEASEDGSVTATEPAVETATVIEAAADIGDAAEGDSTGVASEDADTTETEPGAAVEEPTPVVTAAAPLESLARFELFQDRANEWRWRLVHRNGNVIASSGEGYTRKHNAEKGLRSVMQNAPAADISVEGGESGE